MIHLLQFTPTSYCTYDDVTNSSGGNYTTAAHSLKIFTRSNTPITRVNSLEDYIHTIIAANGYTQLLAHYTASNIDDFLLLYPELFI